jgi:hypothetical protein
MNSPQAQATTPALAWQGVEQVRVLCVLNWNALRGRPELETEICRRIRELAAARTDLAVTELAHGDPALLDPQVLTLLVHAAVDDSAGSSQLLFTIRPFRAGPVDNVILFGSAPRAVPMPVPGKPAPALEAALTAALDELLPRQGRR